MAQDPSAAPVLFDRSLLIARQARALRQGPATFLLDRVAEDMAERLSAVMRDFTDAADVWTPGEGLRLPDVRIKSLTRIAHPAPVLLFLSGGPCSRSTISACWSSAHVGTGRADFPPWG